MTWIPSDLKKTILMIGEGEPRVTPKGSGALVRHKNKIYAITAKHVVQNISNPMLLFNSKSEGILRLPTHDLTERLGVEWVNHSDVNIDLSIIPFALTENHDILVLDSGSFQSFNNINDGDEIFFMGFPFGLTLSERITPLIRLGCVALKFENEREWGGVRYAPKTILIDGHVSAGNSGSPIFSKPTLSDRHARLYGVITSHITSNIFDFSGKAIGRENSGLGIAASIDHIIDLIESL